jgi:uncharacterized membrane protein
VADVSATVISLVTLVGALGSALVAGVFFAFSTFVMPALSRLPPEQGVATMQAINVAAINRWFMGALFGTGAACLVLAVSSLRAWGDPLAGLRLGGAALYIAGAVLVTVVCHVPRNDALAAVPAGSAEAATLWVRYLAGWTTWNHVRAIIPFAAAVLLTFALWAGPAPTWWRGP